MSRGMVLVMWAFWAPTISAASLSSFTPILAGGSATGDPPDSSTNRIDPNTTNSPYAGVVSVNGASGVALTPYHILTAKHVVSGGTATVVVNFGGNATQTLSSAAVALQPSAPGSEWYYNDLAIVTLSQPLAPGVPTYQLYRNAPTTGFVVTLVGYGAYGSGDAAGYPIAGSSTVKRVGFNKLDLIQSDPAGPDAQGRTAQIYAFDFDGPDGTTNVIGPATPPNRTLGNDVEAMLGPGDSGGPAFVDDNGTLRVIAVNGFVTNFGNTAVSVPQWGTGGGGALVFPYLDWIDSVISPVPNPIPEPWPAIPFAAALGFLHFVRRRGRAA